MPSGLRLDTDPWNKEHEDATKLAQDVANLIQDRNLRHPNGGVEASRMTAAARRKTGSLGTAIENLENLLKKSSEVTENEKNRRLDMIRLLKTRRDNLFDALRRDQAAANRSSLLDGAGSRQGPPRETNETATLENNELVGLQQRIIKQQDQELEQIEDAVHNTKHVALAINEEVELQQELLGSLGEDVDVVHSRLSAARKRVNNIMKKSSDWRCWLIVIALVVVLFGVLLFAFKSMIFH